MAVVAVVMAGDEGKPTFHDFFGVSCSEPPPLPPVAVPKGVAGYAPAFSSASSAAASSGAYGPVSASSDLGSGRKPSNSDSSFMGLTRERVLQMGPDALDNQRLMKMLHSEGGSERAKRKHIDGSFIGMQGPRPTSTALILQQPASSRPDIAMSNWDRSLPISVGHVAYHSSRFGQFAPYEDKQSSTMHKDSTGITLISQPAADEGSRTGIKGSTILNLVHSNSDNFERHPSAALPVANRPRPGSNSIETEFDDLPRSTTRQMTIFYAGQAHVFDDVHPSKAEAIMALAGSSGGSWSTACAIKTTARPPITETHTPIADNNRSINTNIANFAHLIHKEPSAVATSTPGRSHSVKISIVNAGADQGGPPGGGAKNILQKTQPDKEGKQDAR